MAENIRHVFVRDTISISLKEHVKLKGWVRSRKKGLMFELKLGDSWHVTERKWYVIRQLVDHFHKRYHKRIVDPATGAVVRDDYKLLHAHQGHGSAKPKPDK